MTNRVWNFQEIATLPSVARNDYKFRSPLERALLIAQALRSTPSETRRMPGRMSIHISTSVNIICDSYCRRRSTIGFASREEFIPADGKITYLVKQKFALSEIGILISTG